jgi:MYXO-CTERM domain-containing protein
VLTDTLFSHNAGGYYWAMDIGYACTTSANGKADCGSRTGVVAANSFVKVPEPGTWTMSIAGLAGLTGLTALRRRRKLVRA